MIRRSFGTCAVAAVAADQFDAGSSALGTSCAALRTLAWESGLTKTARGRAVMAKFLEAARATEAELAEKEERIQYLQSLSMTDELTGLLNRRGFQNDLEKTLARARRTGETGLLALVDLDHFKQINDTYGHEAGDQALIGMAGALVSGLRAGDVAARFGGDEFAILLTHARPSAAKPRLARFRDTLSHLVVAYGRLRVPVSATLGSAPYGPDSEAGILMRMADNALYREKNAREPAS